MLDILKLDVEGSEWSSLRQAIDDGSLRSIKQLIVEIHSPRLRQGRQVMTKQDYADIFQILIDLERLGFRKYLYHADKYCCGGFADLTPVSVAKKLICCYELFYVNRRFWDGGQFPQNA